MRTLLAGAILVLASCQSVEWAGHDPIHGLHWRDRKAFVFGPDVVLARDGSSAENALQTIGELRAALRSDLGQVLGSTLWIAMGHEEHALAADISGILAALGTDPDANEGRTTQMELGGPPNQTKDGRSVRAPTPEEKQRMIGLMARTLTLPLDLTKMQLDLPPVILARVEAAVLYPTDAGLEAVASGVVDVMLELQEMSVLESTVVAMARGTLVDKLAQKFIEQRQYGIVNWIGSREFFQSDDRDTRLAALGEAIGLPAARPEATMPEVSVAEFVAAPTTVFPDSSALPAISWSDSAPNVELGSAIGTHVTVKTNTYFDAIEGRGPGVVILMRKESVRRDDLDALFDRLGDSPGRLLVTATTRELAATVALLHAVERCKLPPTAARELWSLYGMQPSADLTYTGLRQHLGH